MSEVSIQKTIEALLSAMGVSFEAIEEVSVHTHTLWNIQAKERGVHLIGPEGDNLRALTFVVRRLLEKQGLDRNAHFLLDVNGYQQAHIADIEQKARLLGERARTFRSRAELAPMNAYERMIVHALFSEDAELETLSEGEGIDRHVVIRYKEEK